MAVSNSQDIYLPGSQPAEMSCLCPGIPGETSLARMGCCPSLNQSLCLGSDGVISAGPGQVPDPWAGVDSAPPEIHRLRMGLVLVSKQGVRVWLP